MFLKYEYLSIASIIFFSLKAASTPSIDYRIGYCDEVPETCSTISQKPYSYYEENLGRVSNTYNQCYWSCNAKSPNSFAGYISCYKQISDLSLFSEKKGTAKKYDIAYIPYEKSTLVFRHHDSNTLYIYSQNNAYKGQIDLSSNQVYQHFKLADEKEKTYIVSYQIINDTILRTFNPLEHIYSAASVTVSDNENLFYYLVKNSAADLHNRNNDQDVITELTDALVEAIKSVHSTYLARQSKRDEDLNRVKTGTLSPASVMSEQNPKSYVDALGFCRSRFWSQTVIGNAINDELKKFD